MRSTPPGTGGRHGGVPGRLWWRGGTIYQVYVRSWRDGDGDGYGDLSGVIAGLDYLTWLGVDGIWLTPTMPSADHDWGYDVSDYLGVHPDLGTMAQLDRLLSEAKARGLRVLLDLVPNHTSADHPWFIESRASRDSPRRDWYIWADPQDGRPPNNWKDSTGEAAWTFDPHTDQYYLHSFLESQPDLNWRNGDVQREFERIICFWLERGVSGFRVDVAHGLFKDELFRDDPAAPVGISSPFGLAPVFSRNRPEVHRLYRRWREIVSRYGEDKLLLGETWVLDPVEMARYYGDGDELQLAFNFAFFFAELSIRSMRPIVEVTIAALPSGACPVWAGSNHDDSRFPTRWCGDDSRRARLGITLLCTLPGTTVLYYGDELGLGDVNVAEVDQRDRMSWHGNAVRVCRDQARTPMPWKPIPGMGFTGATVRPWLPLGERTGVSVAEQRIDPASFLSLTRSLLQIKPADLSFRTLPSPDGVWAYRSGPLTIACNFSDGPKPVPLPPGPRLSSVTGRTITRGAGSEVIEPWEALVCSPGSARS